MMFMTSAVTVGLLVPFWHNRAVERFFLLPYLLSSLIAQLLRCLAVLNLLVVPSGCRPHVAEDSREIHHVGILVLMLVVFVVVYPDLFANSSVAGCRCRRRVDDDFGEIHPFLMLVLLIVVLAVVFP